jgi:hypothetical protein
MVPDYTQGMTNPMDSRALSYLLNKKGHVIEEGAEIRSTYNRQYDSPNPTIGVVKDLIYQYDQNQTDASQHPQWVLAPFGGKHRLHCTNQSNCSISSSFYSPCHL